MVATEEPRAQVTIYDVAERAGVSPSTVSRAFARPGRVSSRTAARIHEVAAELGYRREALFRPVAPERSHVLGLAVSDITNPFYFGIIRGAEHAAAESGFTLMLGDAHESDEAERRMLARQLPLVDGLIVTSSRLSDTDLRGLARQVPVVVLNRRVHGLPCVVPDNARGVRRAVEHLAELGHTRITYVAGPEASFADGARWRALREACLELELRESRLGPVHPTVSGGHRAAGELLTRRATAVLAYNDLVGIGVLRGLQARGASVPEDVSVVGFDNTLSADLVTPGLTTVALPAVALGETAVRHLVAQVRGHARRRDAEAVLPVQLVVRASTGPAPSQRPDKGGRGSRRGSGPR